MSTSIYFKEEILPDDQYSKEKTDKAQIILHDTAGNSNPINVVAGWKADKVAVATANIIGGLSTKGDAAYDGKIIKCFDSNFWGWGLGIKNDPLKKPRGYYDKRAIQIETCSFGALTKQPDGTFKNWAGGVVPLNQVCDLGFVWRGSQYFQKYTDAQIKALETLILYHCKNHNIVLDKGRVFTVADFEFDIAKFSSKAIAFHVNYRPAGEKADMSPQPNLIAMLNRIHA